MQQNDVIAPVLSYEEINNRAEYFLNTYFFFFNHLLEFI
jgi:hypothetical protein